MKEYVQWLRETVNYQIKEKNRQKKSVWRKWRKHRHFSWK